MKDNKNLCVITGNLILPEKVFVDGGAEKLLEPLREQLKQFVPDLSTTKGRKEIASFAAKFGKSKTLVDGLGKNLKAAYKVKIDPIDRERKIFRDECDKMRDEARKPLTDWEAEQERVKAEEAAKIQFEADYDEALQMNDFVDREREVLRKEAELKRQEEERKAKEEAERLEKERIEREEQLKKEAAAKAVKDAEEKAAKEKAESERLIQEAKDREERLKFEAEHAEQKRLADIEAEKARVENERIAAAQKAERDKQEALDQQRRDQEEKERVERERIAEEKRIADRKAANLNHRKAVNNKVLAKLTTAGMSTEHAKEVMEEIIKNPIPEITINY